MRPFSPSLRLRVRPHLLPLGVLRFHVRLAATGDTRPPSAPTRGKDLTPVPFSPSADPPPPPRRPGNSTAKASRLQLLALMERRDPE
ncbi:hypothetical protein chiPu_0033806, partial [Chiloscyllium punctatum]|nr:hypothetical protein [Chiloscyllium punctatum]